MDELGRLAKLIEQYTENITARDLHKADFDEKFADYLLANGVIVPPCKVDDTVYCIEHTTIRKGVVKQVKSLQDGTDTKFFVQVECEIENPFYSDKRKTKHGIYAVWEIIWGGWHRAFPTREEAEAALKERGRQ